MHSLGSVVVLLTVAVFTVIVCRKLYIPTMLGYIIVGFLSGSSVLNIIHQNEATDFLGEIGIVFLMFSIGLEFSLHQLRSMKKLVFGFGLMQVIITILSIVIIELLFHESWIAALALASALTVSSTAIVIKIMSENGELSSNHGRMTVGVLLMQDIAVVPIMIFMHTLVKDSSTIWIELLLAILKMAVVLFVLLYVGEKLMRPWFNLVAKQEQSELFMLNVLLVTLGVAYLTELTGMSLALGAFVAGMLISETQYRFQVEDDIRPFRDVLLGFFFITIGMKINLNILIENYIKIIFLLLILLILKAVIVFIIALTRKYNKKDGFIAALYLAQGGEFGFVLLALALKDKLISIETVQIGTTAILLSMIITPFIIKIAPWLAEKIFKSAWDEKVVNLHQMLVENMSKNDHVILVGFGSAGQTVAKLLKKEEINYYVLDLNADRVQSAKLSGEPISYGDAKRKDILLAAGLDRARMVVLTTNSFNENERILATIMSEKPSLPVVIRSQDDKQNATLRERGATSVISDDRETGLVLASEAMLHYGIPFFHVYNTIRNVRQNKYEMLKDVYLGADEIAAAQEHKQIYRDSIQITSGSFAIGRALQTLPLSRLKVDLLGVRRGHKNIEHTNNDFLMQENDILMVIGLPADIEMLRQIILDGEN